jgi:hypothetical protein
MRDKKSDWATYYNKVNVGYDYLLPNLDLVNYTRRIKQQKFTNRILGMD